MRYLALAAACAVLAGCNQKTGTAGSTGSASFASSDDSVSYIIGFQIGGNLKEQGVPVRPDMILKGLKDAVAGEKGALTQDQMRAFMMGFQQKMMAAQRSKDSLSSGINQAEGVKFLAENKTKPGVITTSSGLQYKVITQGSGPKPSKTSTVTVNYKGTLLNGDEFDSSYSRNEPATFALNGVIPGWTEGLQLMSKGAKFQFWVPAALAYGEAGSPPKIGPNATLAFEVEMLDIK
jgi:FKBP-type peptidyl-prolyl cis-trans isomerase